MFDHTVYANINLYELIKVDQFEKSLCFDLGDIQYIAIR